MPNTTTNFFSSSSKKDKYLSLRGRIYYSGECWHPEYVNVPTIEAKDYCNTRFPVVERLMGGRSVQRHIHDCAATVLVGRREHCFLIFCKNHKYLLINDIVTGRHTILWKGDIAVMRLGKKNPLAVVNMQSNNANLADFLVRK
ncbi:hypothetical protein BDQ17DRAFT_1422982 [Cyathus striatus]|nr:hypothetical protein BDQ17DRAFT_1422982 [Cyathus striatus]